MLSTGKKVDDFDRIPTSKKMKKEIIEKLSALITVATGFIVGLAWNSAIQGIFHKYYTEQILPMLVYALLVTIVGVMLAIWIGRISERSKEEDKKEN